MKVAIVNCFDTYEIRVKMVFDFFQTKGDQILVIQSDFMHIKKERIQDKKQNYQYVHVKKYSKNLSFSRLYSHWKFSKDSLKVIENYKPDLLYVLIPPNSLTKNMASYRVNNKNVTLIYDVIDLWPETMPISKFKDIFPLNCWKNLRNRYINTADYVITECNLYHKYLNVDKKKLKTIYLAEKSNIHQINPNLDNQILSLCYLGSINNIIDIKKIGEVIKIISDIKPVTLKIIGDGEKKEELISEAKNCGANVVYYGKIFDEKEKQRIFDTCHFGLNIYKDNTLIGLTMKSIDYLKAGLPIINNIKEDSYDIVNKYNCGVNLNEIDQLKYLSVNYDMEIRNNAKNVFDSLFSYSQIEKKYNFLINNK